MNKQKKQLHYTLTLRIYGEDKCFGPGIAELLLQSFGVGLE